MTSLTEESLRYSKKKEKIWALMRDLKKENEN